VLERTQRIFLLRKKTSRNRKAKPSPWNLTTKTQGTKILFEKSNVLKEHKDFASPLAREKIVAA
jgi:hypothetical protein